MNCVRQYFRIKPKAQKFLDFVVHEIVQLAMGRMFPVKGRKEKKIHEDTITTTERFLHQPNSQFLPRNEREKNRKQENLSVQTRACRKKEVVKLHRNNPFTCKEHSLYG